MSVMTARSQLHLSTSFNILVHLDGVRHSIFSVVATVSAYPAFAQEDTELEYRRPQTSLRRAGKI